MRIALLNPTFLMRRPIAELAKLLAGRGHEVVVIWPMDRAKSKVNERHFDKLLKDAPGIEIVPIWSREIESILWSYPVEWGVLKKLSEVGRTCDVVQIWAPFYPLALLPFIMKRLGLIKAPLIDTYDTIPSFSFSMGKNTDRLFRLFFALFTRPLLNAAAVTTLYSQLLIPFAKQAGFSSEKLKVLQTGVDVVVKKAEKDVRQELAIGKDIPIILFIGIINNRKGVFKVVEVANQIKQRGLSAVTVMIGKGKEEPGLAQLIIEKGLQAEVRMLGHRQDVADFYQACTCLFLPAEGEGLPGVIMEAMSYGRPVVASNIPCIPDLVVSGQNGFLLAPNDLEGFTQALATLIENKNQAENMGQQSSKLIANWGWQKRIEEYEKLYTQVVV